LFIPAPPRFDPGEEELDDPPDGLLEAEPLDWLDDPEEAEEEPDDPGTLPVGPPRK
jgi:hypothetical protein